jgi:ribosome-binding ATPase
MHFHHVRSGLCYISCFLLILDRGLGWESGFVARQWGQQQRPNRVCLSNEPSKHHAHLSMKVKVGIVGLPNIGKSTFFNALAKKSIAQADNFPFCTIDPNIAPIAVLPDAHLTALAHLARSDKVVPAVMEFVDVAGLVAGASRGEGLGNRFLATIRECDAICHVVRFFEDPDIVHIAGRVDPRQDAEIVNLELVLADIAHIEKRLEKPTCQGFERETLEQLLPELHKGIPARMVDLSHQDAFAIKSMGLLTLKPVLYVFNVDETDFLLAKEAVLEDAKRVVDEIQFCDPTRDQITLVSAKLEAHMASLPNEDAQKEYLQSLGVDFDETNIHARSEKWSFGTSLSYSMIPRLIMSLLDLFLVYTGPGVPPERSRTTKAYLYPRSQAPNTLQLAGKLHKDIQRGFIRAEVATASALLQYSTYSAAKEAGVIRTEGKDAVLHDNDVVLIKWK